MSGRSSKPRYSCFLTARDRLSRLRANNEYLISRDGGRYPEISRFANARLEGNISGRRKPEDCRHGMRSEWSGRVETRECRNIVAWNWGGAQSACLRRWTANDDLKRFDDRQ